MSTFRQSQEEAEQFFREVAALLKTPCDTEEAFQITKAVLHTLRDCITCEESMHLVAQLPVLIKGIYFDGWKRNYHSHLVQNMDEFLEEIRQHAPEYFVLDFSRNTLTVEKAKAVIQVLRNHSSAGGFWHVRNQMPKQLSSLFDIEE